MWTMRLTSPIGLLELVARDDALCELVLPPLPPRTHANTNAPSALLERAAKQVDEYFAGARECFDLPLAPAGTAFQQRVWRALLAIPFGTTWSYGELARSIEQPSASRAVGAANGKNPIAVIIPCHRVIGADGALTGYGGGMAAKRWLLDHERGQPAQLAMPLS